MACPEGTAYIGLAYALRGMHAKRILSPAVRRSSTPMVAACSSWRLRHAILSRTIGSELLNSRAEIEKEETGPRRSNVAVRPKNEEKPERFGKGLARCCVIDSKPGRRVQAHN